MKGQTAHKSSCIMNMPMEGEQQQLAAFDLAHIVYVQSQMNAQ